MVVPLNLCDSIFVYCGCLSGKMFPMTLGWSF